MATQPFCGLDFGTSNSTIGIYKNNNFKIVPLENGKPTLRSAIFFDFETNTCQFGQQGITDYLSGLEGRLMMSLKSVLGSSLMEEDTLINNKWVPYTDILGCLIRYIKNKAEIELGHALSDVVLGRPVHFHDDDPKKDQIAQDTLEKIARAQGFKNVYFQYEPIAAALTYEQSITQEQLALIVDLGGGTSDFSVIRLRPNIFKNDRKADVLANDGIHIGGTDFDTVFNLNSVMPHLGLGGELRGMNGMLPIPNSYYYDLTTWHTLNLLYTPQVKKSIKNIKNLAMHPKLLNRLYKVVENQLGHKILNEVERNKCVLSMNEQTIIDLSFIENDFTFLIHRNTFQDIIQDKVSALIRTLLNTVQTAGIRNSNIHSIFFTGGSTQIPMIRQQIKAHFPTTEIVQGNVFESVGKGLIIDAQQRFL